MVTPDVLIPRPETELIVELALKEQRNHHSRSVIWDVGTGSGAIAITLSKELENKIPAPYVIASDVSKAALKVARANAKRHHAHVTFIAADLLNNRIQSELREAEGTSLLITANLPYLPNSDKKILAPDVIKFEPSSALFSGKEGLDLTTKFLDQIEENCRHWGFKHITILVEFDPPQAKKLLRLAKILFSSAKIAIHKDLAGRHRVLVVILADAGIQKI
jgi:release factor glutamine methyltransferase